MGKSKAKKSKKPFVALAGVVAIVGLLVGASYYVLHRNINLLGLNIPKNLPASHASQDVYLNNGQSYNLSAGFVSNDLNGRTQPMLAYNGSIPGPTFHVKQGDKVTVNFKNEINMDTTVHAHGLRQDVKMDGTPGMSQEPVKVGDSFKYEWSFPDAGIYWYHPHIREDYQQGSGMYGAIIVAPKDSTYWPAADSEQTLILSDALTDSKTGLLVPFNKNAATHTLMGRYGNVLLINGKTNWQTTAKANTVQRLYIANASNARPYRFALEGVKMKIIGSDNGRVGSERFVDALTLSPGERYIVDVVFDKTGPVQIMNNAPGSTSTIGMVKVGSNDQPSSAVGQYATLRTNTDVSDEIKSLASKVNESKRLLIGVTMSGGMSGMSGMSGMDSSSSSTMTMPDGSMMDSSGNTVDPETNGIEWTNANMNMDGTQMSGKWSLTDQDTNKSNADVNWTFKKGEVVRIRINNPSSSMHPMQHPIHIHGQRFAVVSKNGMANTNLEWKDTVTVPSGQSYELLVEMDNPGEWMLHCHIAEHLEAGMAISFKVEE